MLAAPGQALRLTAECATLQVPFAPSSERKIPLFVARFSASGGTPHTDPIVIVPGGPGQSATESFFGIQGAFMEANAKRDILLIDPRGTGRSHPLECKSASRDALLRADSDAPPTALISKCRGDMSDDPTAFTTEQLAKDLDAVRAQLGYEQWNLYGVSYGSRLSLAYLRQFPQHVRTLVLDGVAPPQTIIGSNSAEVAERALALVSARGAPDFEANLLALKLPRVVEIAHPRTGKRINVRLSKGAVRELVHMSLYMPEILAPLPRLVKNAVEREDYAPLASLLELQRGGALASVNPWLNLAVLCHEDAPFLTTQTPGPFFAASELQATCAAFNVGKVDPQFHDPVRSDKPVLLLSGEADPVTPPANAEAARATLPKSKHIVLKGQGHNVAARGCLHHVIARFIESADPIGLDATCTDKVRPFALFQTETGP